MGSATRHRLSVVVEKLAPNEFVYLSGLGWVERTAGAPPSFLVDPALVCRLNQRPAPMPLVVDEVSRLSLALRECSGRPVGPSGRLAVMRFAWADQLAAEVVRQLLDTGRAELPAVATLQVVGGDAGCRLQVGQPSP